jgi:hypothetical protein
VAASALYNDTRRARHNTNKKSRKQPRKGFDHKTNTNAGSTEDHHNIHHEKIKERENQKNTGNKTIEQSFLLLMPPARTAEAWAWAWAYPSPPQYFVRSKAIRHWQSTRLYALQDCVLGEFLAPQSEEYEKPRTEQSESALA